MFDIESPPSELPYLGFYSVNSLYSSSPNEKGANEPEWLVVKSAEASVALGTTLHKLLNFLSTLGSN